MPTAPNTTAANTTGSGRRALADASGRVTEGDGTAAGWRHRRLQLHGGNVRSLQSSGLDVEVNFRMLPGSSAGAVTQLTSLANGNTSETLGVVINNPPAPVITIIVLFAPTPPPPLCPGCSWGENIQMDLSLARTSDNFEAINFINSLAAAVQVSLPASRNSLRACCGALHASAHHGALPPPHRSTRTA